MACGRQYCKYCDEELIHRDNRRHFESASAFGQIIHRQGPRETTCGDVDLYLDTRFGRRSLFRIVERFQAHSAMKPRQRIALTALDLMIRHAVTCPLFTELPLAAGSGVCVVRGELGAATTVRREVDFLSHQIIDRLDGTRLFLPAHREEMWSWLIGTTSWSRMDRKPRAWPVRVEASQAIAGQTAEPRKSIFEATLKLLPQLSSDELAQLRHRLALERAA